MHSNPMIEIATKVIRVFYTELLYAGLISLLVAVCIYVTVETGQNPESRRAKTMAIIKSIPLAFVAGFVGTYFLRHPPPDDPIKHVVRTPADF